MYLTHVIGDRLPLETRRRHLATPVPADPAKTSSFSGPQVSEALPLRRQCYGKRTRRFALEVEQCRTSGDRLGLAIVDLDLGETGQVTGVGGVGSSEYIRKHTGD